MSATLVWLAVLLSLAGSGPLETREGLLVKEELLLLPPHAVTRYKILPPPQVLPDSKRYHIYQVKPLGP